MPGTVPAIATAPTDVIERYLAAIAGHDWDGLAACLADDVVRTGPFGDTYTGKADYVRFLRDLMPTLPGYSMDVDRVVYSDRVAMVELSETITVDGGPLRTPESLVFDLTDDGLIRRVAIYIQQRPA